MVVIEEGEDFVNANEILERIGENYSSKIIDTKIMFRYSKEAIPMVKTNLELLKVNHSKIDKQHEMMFSMFSVLVEAIRAGQTSKQLGLLFLELLEYTDMHFQTEESLMEQCAYPGLTRHRSEHKKIFMQAKEFKENDENGKATLTVGIFIFLFDWMKNHILQEDKEFIQFLNQIGVR